MIKASELRIGSYITDINAGDKFFSQVIKIDYSRCYYGYFSASYEDLKPIELTEEWLLKFGFEKEYSKLTNITTFNLPNTPFSYCQGKLILKTGTGDFCVNIKHVHTLQNLYFSLTNEELKINE